MKTVVVLTVPVLCSVAHRMRGRPLRFTQEIFSESVSNPGIFGILQFMLLFAYCILQRYILVKSVCAASIVDGFEYNLCLAHLQRRWAQATNLSEPPFKPTVS